MQHRGEASPAGATQCQEMKTDQTSVEEKKSKKTWKKSLLSWWKSSKKSVKRSESAFESAHGSCNLKIREGNASGMIYSNNKKRVEQSRRPKSGPVTYLFSPTRAIESAKAIESETPYLALSQSPNRSPKDPYGPVYFVT